MGIKSRIPHLIPSLIGGSIIGVFEVAFVVSFITLIYTGVLADYVSNGIALGLIGAMLSILIVALFTSQKGTVAASQDAPAAVLAVMAAAIVSTMPAGDPADETFATVLVAIALTTFLIGLVFVILGVFKLGSLIRFLPYPVIGGFLAGTGWLLTTGAIGIMAGGPVTFGGIGDLFQPETLIRWLPGLFFALLLLFVSVRNINFQLLPLIIIGAGILFFVVAALLGVSPAELSEQGWLLGPFPSNSLWPPLSTNDLAGINWQVLFRQLPTVATVILVSVVGMLLNATGLEAASGRQARLNQELRASGGGNVLAGLVGGLPGFQSISLSVLNFKLGATSSLSGIVAVAICAITLFFGASLLSYAPNIIIGGLLLYLGLSFLYEWVYETWFKFPKIDYAIIIGILAVIAAFGFLAGVAVGILAAVAMFVVAYSQVDVVRHSLTGHLYQSRVMRGRAQQQHLQKHSDDIFILELQGFIFFGTANNLLEKVRQRVENSEDRPVRFILLDFQRVTDLDSTAILSFNRMKDLAQAHDAGLVFTGMTDRVNHRFAISGMAKDEDGVLYLFTDLDHGLEWCEDELLEAAGLGKGAIQERFEEQLSHQLPQGTDAHRLLSYLEPLEVEAGTIVIRQGDPPDNLYFVASGQLTAQFVQPGESPIRLETMHGGRIVGEMGFYLGTERTAEVVADVPSVLYYLSAENMARMEKEAPELVSALHRAIVSLMAERVALLTQSVNALRR